GLLESLLHVLRSHPSASQLILDGEKQSDAALVAMETALAVLRRGGFYPQHARATAPSAPWTGPTRAMRRGCNPGLAGAERAEAQRQARVRLALLPSAQYPCLIEAAEPMSSCDPDFHYKFGMDLFIAGVRAMAPRA